MLVTRADKNSDTRCLSGKGVNNNRIQNKEKQQDSSIVHH